MRLFAAVLILAGLCPAVASSQDSGLEALETANDTRGWEGVGRIDIAERAFCTGALIAADLVLTAAHCLFERDTGQRVATNLIQFRAGWRNGRAIAYRGVKRAVIHPSYVYGGPEDMEGVAFDLALLELDQPIRLASVRPFDTGADPRAGDRVEVVSYAFDRSEAPSLQEDCRVIGPQPGMMVFSCSVDFGSSGAPIFRVIDGVPRIVSVVSAKAEMNGNPVSIGARLGGPLRELRAAYALPPVSVGPSKIKPGLGLPQIRPSTGGAKFVKP